MKHLLLEIIGIELQRHKVALVMHIILFEYCLVERYAIYNETPRISPKISQLFSFFIFLFLKKGSVKTSVYGVVVCVIHKILGMIW